MIFTSDNGPVVDDGYKDDAVAKLGSHTPVGPFRGGKYSHFEGGTRVPFIVRWPARVKPGTSDALVSQVDFLASFAAFLKRPLAAGDGPDSVDTMGALLGTSKRRPDRADRAGRRPGAARRARGSTSRPASGPRMNVADEHRARQRRGAAALRSVQRSWRAAERRRRSTREGEGAAGAAARPFAARPGSR